MGYNDESLSVKINRFANAIGSTASSIYESKVQKDMRMQEITLQRAKYLDNLDANVYSASSQKALKGIESLFYGNSKTGTSGFFKDQLNGMDYELYQQDTDAMIAEMLSVEYLSKNYGMTESHAQRFIDEYGSTITAEANQRTQTNTFLSMQTQLGSDMAAFTTLQANGGTSALQQYQNIVKHYNDVGGSSWDITGTYNPEKIENRLSFGYEWSISAGKRIVDSGLTTIGMTTEEIVRLALEKYDTAMSEMGDGSNISNATISGNRGEFEKYIRSYISQQSGFAYDESESKYLTASNIVAEVYQAGKYIDSEKFNEIVKDCKLNGTNAYDLAMINKLKLNISDLNEKTAKNASQPSIMYPSFFSDYLLDPRKTADDCKAALSSMYNAGEIDDATYGELSEMVKNRTNPFIDDANYIIEAVKAGLSGTDMSPYLESKLKSDPSFYKQIYNRCLSNPKWSYDERKSFIDDIVADFESEDMATTISDLLTFSFGKATGYSFVIEFSEDTSIYDLRTDYYNGNNANLLRPQYAKQIETSIINGQFSSEQELVDSVSALFNNGKKYDELNAYEKNEVMFNIAIVGLNSMEFGNLSNKLDDLYGDEAHNIRQVDIYGVGAGGVDEQGIVYYLDENDQLYMGQIPFTSEERNSIFSSDSEYGVQIYKGDIKNFKVIDVKPAKKTDPIVEEYSKEKSSEEKDYSLLGLASKVGQAASATSAGVSVGSIGETQEALGVSEVSRNQTVSKEEQEASEQAVDAYWEEKNNKSWTLGKLWQGITDGIAKAFSSDDGGVSEAFELSKISEEAKSSVEKSKVTTEQQKIFFGALNSLLHSTSNSRKNDYTYETK